MNRRAFLKGTAALAAASALPRLAKADNLSEVADDYGPLSSVSDRIRSEAILELPKDFWYTALTADGDKMRDGYANPSGPRQLGCFRLNGQNYVARNHVGKGDSSIGPASSSHQPTSPGGVVCLILESGTNELLRDWCILAGVNTPIAGTPTPWGTWLTVDSEGAVFETSIRQRELTKPKPIRPFGDAKVSHLAYSSPTHLLYGVDSRSSRLLRWRPKSAPDLNAGGELHEMTVSDWQPNGTSALWTVGPTSGVSGSPKIHAIHPSGEGLLLVVSGGRDTTEVWRLQIGQRQTSQLKLVQTIQLNASEIGQVAVSPTGAIVIAAKNRIVGFEIGKKQFDFVRTTTASQGFTGLAFSTDGTMLVAALDQPGIFVAISGPWEKGPL